MQRKQKGIAFTNPLAGSIMCYYPAEYQMGRRCLETIRQKTGIALNDDEASFIALHIVNAEMNTHMSEMYDITKLIDGCIDVVEAYYHKQFDRQSLDFSRFVVHLRYFAKRVFQGKTLPADDCLQLQKALSMRAAHSRLYENHVGQDVV